MQDFAPWHLRKRGGELLLAVCAAGKRPRRRRAIAIIPGMASGSVATPFFKEVEDAIKANPPHVSDLVVLRDLCREVEAGKKPAASKLTAELLKLDGTEDPLHAISYELFHAMLARVLVQGWLSEFGLLLRWEQTLFGSRDVKIAAKWEGIIKIVREDPALLGLLSRSNYEQAWMRAVNGLAGAIEHFRDVKLPSPSTMGAPPLAPPDEERALPRQLLAAIEEFYRAVEMQFELILELALARLEQDPNDVAVLRKLQALQPPLEAKLPPLQDPPNDKMNRVLRMNIRVAEVRYGVGRSPHRFLDAFQPHAARSVVFSSLDREDRDRPTIRGEMLGAIHLSRLRQIGFYLSSYGHPWDADARPTFAHVQRRRFISGKLGGHLRLADRDAVVVLLAAFFEDRFQVFSSAGAAPFQAGEDAWYETVNLWSLILSQTCSHSRHNLTEGPPNYLEHAFPRNLAGRMLHDCGVFAVRTAFTLLSVLERIERAHPGATGTVQTFWVRFPLHVGLLIDSSELGVVVQHNEHALALGDVNLKKIRAEWDSNGPAGGPDAPAVNDLDPADPAQAKHKFFEDIAANVFSSDLDMPVSSTPVLKPNEAVTARSIWDSYERKVVPSQLFTDLVGAPNSPQYQFDRRYLLLSELEREWYNRIVVTFWNVRCNAIWAESSKLLLDPRTSQKARAEKIAEYSRSLNDEIDKVQDSYLAEIVPKKRELSKDLRADPKLLLANIRIVASVRIEAKLPSEEKIQRHLDEIKNSNFVFTPDYQPPFAKPEEALSVVP